MIHVANIVGARPNLVKIAALLSAQRARPDCFRPQLIHTGQHHDASLSADLLGDLELPPPDLHLGICGGDRSGQLVRMVRALEGCFVERRPDLVVVVGDVNSTLAAAIAAHNCALPIAHVEAGLRSFDPSMPEEMNRIVTDSLSQQLFASEPSAVENLRRESYPSSTIHLVGNVMIDTLIHFEPLAAARDTLAAHGVVKQAYAVLTLHRPATVDREEAARPLLAAAAELADRLPVVFPMHPRTRKAFARFGLLDACGKVPRLLVTPPLRYLDMLALVRAARLVLTDSGGLQEETSYLGVPCLTLRDGTERPYTVTHGTNRVIGTRPGRLLVEADRLLGGDVPPRRPMPLWDGRAAERITAVLAGDGSPRPAAEPAAPPDHLAARRRKVRLGESLRP